MDAYEDSTYGLARMNPVRDVLQSPREMVKSHRSYSAYVIEPGQEQAVLAVTSYERADFDTAVLHFPPEAYDLVRPTPGQGSTSTATSASAVHPALPLSDTASGSSVSIRSSLPAANLACTLRSSQTPGLVPVVPSPPAASLPLKSLGCSSGREALETHPAHDSALPTSPSRCTLVTLPVELLWQISLTCDIQSVVSLRQSSARLRAAVDTCPAWRETVAIAPNLVLGLVAGGTAQQVTLQGVQALLRTEACTKCGRFAVFVALVRVARCCARCLAARVGPIAVELDRVLERLADLPADRDDERARKYAEELANADIPVFRVLAGEYGLRPTFLEGGTRLVHPHDALRLLVALGLEESTAWLATRPGPGADLLIMAAAVRVPWVQGSTDDGLDKRIERERMMMEIDEGPIRENMTETDLHQWWDEKRRERLVSAEQVGKAATMLMSTTDKLDLWGPEAAAITRRTNQRRGGQDTPARGC